MFASIRGPDRQRAIHPLDLGLFGDHFYLTDESNFEYYPSTGNSAMDETLRVDIIESCLEIDRTAHKVYESFSVHAEEPELKEFWRRNRPSDLLGEAPL